MKKILLSIAAVLLATSVWAQAPMKFNYQGVARDNTGKALDNKNISMRISILDGSAVGTAQYVETQSATTNQFGLYTVQIGNGTAVTGTMGAVTWGTGNQEYKYIVYSLGLYEYCQKNKKNLMWIKEFDIL